MSLPSLPTCCMPAWRALVAFLAIACASAAAHAGVAYFELHDRTNLTPGTYQIYVTGFSTAGPYILQQDGSWQKQTTAPTATTTLPCYRFPQDLKYVQIDGSQTDISARVYYFVVTDATLFLSCAPATGTNGLFNQAGLTTAFTYSSISPMNLSEPPTSAVGAKQFPAWTFSEIGASAAAGTIDLSQVDFFAFPMSTSAAVTAVGTGVPPNPSVMGNPVNSTADPNANPGDAVNHLAIRDSYQRFVDALAEAANHGKPCSADATPPVCAYLDLLQDVTTPNSTATQYVIQNPGGYLAQNSATTQASALNTVFDGLIAKLWAGSGAPTLTIDTGGALGSVPEDVFTSTMTSFTFPGSSPATTVSAMKFTGTAKSGNYVAYLVSPKDLASGCNAGAIAAEYCPAPTSTAYQVFAGAGVFGTPNTDYFTGLQTAGLLPSTYAYADWSQVVARLGFLVSGAMNRGVAMVPCTGNATWQCWQDETYWYPTAVSSTFPDITQNLFSRWMHQATIGGTPMFVRPPSAVKGASSTAGTGRTMGMAYGFSNDEMPTPTVPAPPAAMSPQPEVPSKFDQTVVYGNTTATAYRIVFGPWVTPPTPNPTLHVRAKGGTVTSSPAGIDCGSDCSQSYPANTAITLTAQPDPSAIFVRWEGGCTGSSTTCALTLSTTTTVTAVFGMIAAMPSQYGLHVIVSGNGSVASAPAGIACGSACSTAVAANAAVTLTATPAAGATFTGWTGACTGTAPTCALTMTQSRTAGATFATAAQKKLTVTAGTGGVITSDPQGIDCGTRCIAAFAAGAHVTLTARPQPGYRFSGWSGACSGSAPCTLTLADDVSVQASFAAVAAGQSAVTVQASGGGTVQSVPAGIDCGATCSVAFPANTTLTLLATAKPGYQFAGWSGACAGTGACSIYVDDIATVGATFAPLPGPGPLPPGEPIPTLSEWMLAVMCVLLLGAGAPALRRVRTRR